MTYFWGVILCKALDIEALVVLPSKRPSDRLFLASQLEFVVSLGNFRSRGCSEATFTCNISYLSQDIVSLTVNDKVMISTRCSILGFVPPLSSGISYSYPPSISTSKSSSTLEKEGRNGS